MLSNILELFKTSTEKLDPTFDPRTLLEIPDTHIFKYTLSYKRIKKHLELRDEAYLKTQKMLKNGNFNNKTRQNHSPIILTKNFPCNPHFLTTPHSPTGSSQKPPKPPTHADFSPTIFRKSNPQKTPISNLIYLQSNLSLLPKINPFRLL